MNLWKNKINNNRFGGKTKKFKNNKGEWEYKTEIRNENNELIAVINENYMIIYDTNKNYCKYWTKRTTNENDAITFEIFLTKDNELYKYVKEYKNINELTNEIENNQVLNSPPIRSKLSKILEPVWNLL